MTTRIAYLTGEYPRATDTFIQREIAGLRALGHDVLTTSIRRTGSEHHVGPEQVAEAAATFNVLENAKNPAIMFRAIGKSLGRPKRLWQALRLAFQTSPPGCRNHVYQLFYLLEAMLLSDHLERSGVQHLHNHIAKASCTVAMLTSKLSGIPFSFTLHGPDIFFEPMHWRLDEKIANAAFVACISDFCRSQGMAFSDPAHWERLHLIHCGVEPERYTAKTHTETPGHLLFVGRLAAVKGVPVLIDAIRKLHAAHPGLKVTLVGDGPDRKSLEDSCRDLKDVVHFAGYKSQSEVAQILGDVDMLVLPSFAEGVPVVLMEAMAAGLPVVTTRIAGIPELVHDGQSGLLVAPGDCDALAAAIKTLLKDPALRSQMGRSGRARVLADYVSSTESARLSSLIESHRSGTIQSRRPEVLA